MAKSVINSCIISFMYILYIDNWDFLNVKLHQSAVINIINGMFLDS